MSSIVSQIDYYEGRVDHCEKRLDDIMLSLKDADLSTKRRDDLMVEKEQLTSTLFDHQKNLSSLRHENRRTMAVSVAIFVIIIMVFLLTTLE